MLKIVLCDVILVLAMLEGYLKSDLYFHPIKRKMFLIIVIKNM